MKVKIFAVILCVSLLFCGCTGGRNLNDMTVVQAISLDEKDGKVLLGIQYLDLNKGSGKNEGLNSSLTANAYSVGDTVESAVKNLSETLPDDYFTEQAKLIILGQEFIEKRSGELQKVLIEDKRIRCDMLVVKSKSAKDVLENGFRNERVPIDGICKEIRRKKAKVTVNSYLNEENIKLPEIVTGKDYGKVLY